MWRMRDRFFAAQGNSLDPRSLTVTRLARGGSTNIGSKLTVLRLVGKSVGEVSGAPDLIRVLAGAAPDLDLLFIYLSFEMSRKPVWTHSVSIGLISVGEIDAFTLAGPG